MGKPTLEIAYFYPRSPCGERLGGVKACFLVLFAISIHALLAESDGICACMCIIWHTFLSTLSLRRATVDNTRILALIQFLSTLSLRRATPHLLSGMIIFANFYPRSPCGERRFENQFLLTYSSISIHALLAESDQMLFRQSTQEAVFLSTLSLRRATCGRRVGLPVAGHFYPRSPCGERLKLASCAIYL